MRLWKVAAEVWRARRRIRLGRLGRWFWGIMFAIHLPATITVSISALRNDEPHLLRLLLLTASQVFFFLKFADVGWLRVPGHRRVWISGILIVLLLHGDPLARLWVDQDPAYLAFCALAVVSSAATAVDERSESPGCRTMRRRLLAVLSAGAFRRQLLRPHHCPTPSSWEVLLLRAGRVNRAPPLHPA